MLYLRPHRRFAQSRLEAVLTILSGVTAIFTVLRYGTVDTIVVVLLMVMVIAGAVAFSTSLDRGRWTVVSAGLMGVWIVCVPIHALLT